MTHITLVTLQRYEEIYHFDTTTLKHTNRVVILNLPSPGMSILHDEPIAVARKTWQEYVKRGYNRTTTSLPQYIVYNTHLRASSYYGQSPA